MTRSLQSNIQLPTVHAAETAPPPPWALLERHLIDVMNRAALEFVARYTREDGTFVWRREWPGMDGSDDGYESFGNFPLFYALGGDEQVHALARKEWNAVTWQFTEYGQVHNEFDAYYDWMHHGESSQYIYYFGLADPAAYQDRQRALRFAGLYMNEDPAAANYDPDLKLIRSPINGSRGPRFEMSAVDWVTHRPILADYPAPYEDIPGVTTVKADWNDDAVFAEILKLMNARMAKGDVPLNLTCTSLIANAFLYTADKRYQDWVVNYIQAWCERTAANNGICPDNVGLSGKIGECMDGKWWGGYYGWHWPHGAMNILESTLIAAANAQLLTGDASCLDFPRSQQDLLWQLGQEDEGGRRVPHRHGDSGWYDFRRPDPRLYLQLWYLTMEERDRERLLRLDPNRESWRTVRGGRDKGDQGHAAAWYEFITGDNPDFPEAILAANYAEVCRRLDVMRHDDTDPETWDVHHWQQINPVTCEGLVQLTLGGPMPVYHGGLLHSRVRYFDPAAGHPGLPDAVAALVERVNPQGIVLQLVNLDPQAPRELIVQAGAFREHRFTEIKRLNEDAKPVAIGGPYVAIQLDPAASVRLEMGIERYAYVPTYARPWDGAEPKSIR